MSAPPADFSAVRRVMAEIRFELTDLVFGRVAFADSVVPPLLFVVANALWGVTSATVVGVAAAVMITLWRLVRGRPVRFALAGLLGTVFAAALALRSGSAGDFFLPGIISGLATAVVIVLSIGVRRPFVAWTSWLTRGWPLGWYWHPNVRPAYTRASWVWAGFFALRTWVQWRLYLGGDAAALGLARILLGWPALLVLLISTYLLGRRWLVELRGPSVEEYQAGSSQPWEGQTVGF